jgi:predicted outer membrane repeat protein
MRARRRVWLIAAALLASAAHGDAVVTLCGQDVWPNNPGTDLSEALAIGGRITFACTGRIKFSRSHGFATDTQIEGANRITLDGEGHRMFGLGSSRGTRVSFQGIRIEDAGLGNSTLPGSVIAGEGFVFFLEGSYIEKSPKPVWIMAGDLTLQRATIALNQGPSLIVSEGTLSITDSSLQDNSGPLIHTSASATVRIERSQFNRNGHSVFGSSSNPVRCQVSIANSHFASNSSTANGGAIHSYCDLTLEESWFEHNRAAGSGGAILLDGGASARMRVVKFALSCWMAAPVQKCASSSSSATKPRSMAAHSMGS